MTVALVSGLLSILYLGSLAAAAGCDLRSYTIPNRLSGLVALTGLAALALAAPGWEAAALYLGVAAAVLTVGAGLFFAGLWGGGDAKLLAATALWVGPSGLPVLLLWMAVSGGGMAFILLAVRRLPWAQRMRKTPHCPQLLLPTQGIPYGVAIALGGILAFFSGNTVISSGFIYH